MQKPFNREEIFVIQAVNISFNIGNLCLIPLHGYFSSDGNPDFVSFSNFQFVHTMSCHHPFN